MVWQHKVTRLSGPCLLAPPSNKPIHAISESISNCKCASTYLSQELYRLGRPYLCVMTLGQDCAESVLLSHAWGHRFHQLNSACSFCHVLVVLKMHDDALWTTTEEQKWLIDFLRSQASCIRSCREVLTNGYYKRISFINLAVCAFGTQELIQPLLIVLSLN